MFLIKDGRMIDPKTKKDDIIDVVVKDGEIYRIGKYQINDDYEFVIDAKGKIVAPGLIDVHVHFRDPGFTYKEDIYTGAKAAARGGFTTVICMANTNPVVDNIETLDYINEKATKAKIHVLQTAAITKGLKGKELINMEAMKEAGAVGFSDDGIPILETKVVIESMEMAKSLNMVLSFHEEDPGLIKEFGVNEGNVAKLLGINGACHTAEDVMVARDCMLAIKTKARINIQHVSSGISVDMIRLAKSLGADVWAEVSPHHFSLTEDAVLEHGPYAKMNPPLRTDDDRYKIIEGLKNGTIDIIATDHAPHSKEDKDKNLVDAPCGIIGLETSLALGVTNLVRKGHLTIMQLLEKMTVNPAELYGLELGTITQGARADLVIFDPSENWVVKDFESKSSNSPFVGQSLYGKIKYTICDGNIVYRDVE